MLDVARSTEHTLLLAHARRLDLGHGGIQWTLLARHHHQVCPTPCELQADGLPRPPPNGATSRKAPRATPSRLGLAVRPGRLHGHIKLQLRQEPSLIDHKRPSRSGSRAESL